MDALIYKDTIYGGGGAMRGNYFNPIIYSTEERKVGVWIDNKPLYQKTWILSNEVLVDSNGITISEIDASMIEHLIGCNGGYQPLSNTKSIPIMVWKYINTWYYGSSINAYVDTITLLYTKTTDVAGSGQYTTLGVPAVHYTTEEQVIGTWMGETLYQRTFDLSNTTFTDNSWNNNILGTNGSGISIKEYDGYFGLSGYDMILKFEYFRDTGEYFTACTNGDASDLNVRPNMNAGVSVKGNTVTIKYTKTTD